jgi:outer membrane protein assembly factor BamB
MPLSVGLKHYSVKTLFVVFTVAIVFSSLFIVFSSHTVSSTTIPIRPLSDSFAGSNVPMLLWNYTTNSRVGIYYTFWGEVYTSPIIDQGIIYFASKDDDVYALNADSGTKVWRSDYEVSKLLKCDRMFPMVDDGKIFVCGFRRLYALDANNGTQIWEKNFGGSLCLCGPSYFKQYFVY